MYFEVHGNYYYFKKYCGYMAILFYGDATRYPQSNTTYHQWTHGSPTMHAPPLQYNPHGVTHSSCPTESVSVIPKPSPIVRYNSHIQHTSFQALV
jgi:hypothetical protein